MLKGRSVTRLSAVCCVGIAALPAAAETYRGEFVSLNAPRVAQTVTGEVSVTRTGDDVVFAIDADGLSPGMHLAHLHGFPEVEPKEAVCPTASADVNGDGLVDLIETRDASGVTMIPLTDDPVSLALHSESYPRANAQGHADYRKTVSFSQLEAAVRKQFGSPPAFERRVVYIHGAPKRVRLPDSVQSLEGVPASVTVPIACAVLTPQSRRP